jgi:hypothetical protein
MDRNENRDLKHPQDAAAKLSPLGYIAAAVLAVPVGAVAWFELAYLWFGLTGEDAPAAFNAAAGMFAFGLALGWPLHGARRPAEVIQRGCQLGQVLALLLPVVAIVVLLLWENASDRPDLGMGGLMLYSLPVVAFGAAVALLLVFWLIYWLAGRRLRPNQAATSQ